MLLAMQDGVESSDEAATDGISFISWSVAGLLLFSFLFSGAIEWAGLYRYIMTAYLLLVIYGGILYAAPKNKLWGQRTLGVLTAVLSILNLLVYL